MAKKVVKRKGHPRKAYTRKDGTKVRSTKVKPTKYKIEKKKAIKVLIAHDNRLGSSTTKAHKFAERIGKNKEYDIIIDKNRWKLKEKTSHTETNKREKEMVSEADVIIRIIPSPSKTGQERHKGAQSEIRKAIKASKPLIEIYEKGARDGPGRPLAEKNYGKREEVHLKPGETLDKAFTEAIEKLKKKKLL